MSTSDDRVVHNREYMQSVLRWPGILAGLRKAQAADLTDLLRVADENEDFPLRPLLARAWAAGWVAGWDDKQPGNPLSVNPFDR